MLFLKTLGDIIIVSKATASVLNDLRLLSKWNSSPMNLVTRLSIFLFLAFRESLLNSGFLSVNRAAKYRFKDRTRVFRMTSFLKDVSLELIYIHSEAIVVVANLIGSSPRSSVGSTSRHWSPPEIWERRSF